MIGLCQLLASGTVPPNRGLDCVDEALADNEHLVWLRRSLSTGPLRAGLVTSLGFGHVSAMVAVAHPGAFVAALAPDQREAWLARASARLVAGQTRMLDAMCGGDALFAKTEQRRFNRQRHRPDQGRRERDARRPGGPARRRRLLRPGTPPPAMSPVR